MNIMDITKENKVLLKIIAELEDKLNHKDEALDNDRIKIAELEKQAIDNESYFTVICEALNIEHESSLTDMLVRIEEICSMPIHIKQDAIREMVNENNPLSSQNEAWVKQYADNLDKQ